jgi:hypothetical protein
MAQMANGKGWNDPCTYLHIEMTFFHIFRMCIKFQQPLAAFWRPWAIWAAPKTLPIDNRVEEEAAQAVSTLTHQEIRKGSTFFSKIFH